MRACVRCDCGRIVGLLLFNRREKDPSTGHRFANGQRADAFLLRMAQEDPGAGTGSDLPGTDHGAQSDHSEAGIARRLAREDSLLVPSDKFPTTPTVRIAYSMLCCRTQSNAPSLLVCVGPNGVEWRRT